MLKQIRFAILSGLLATLALAAGNQATLTWSAPTAYSDGTVIGANDLAYYTVTYGTNALKVIAPATTVVIPVACGSTSFSITVTTSATAVYPNATSAPDGPVPYATGIACVPNPPTGLAAH